MGLLVVAPLLFGPELPLISKRGCVRVINSVEMPAYKKKMNG